MCTRDDGVSRLKEQLLNSFFPFLLFGKVDTLKHESESLIYFLCHIYFPVHTDFKVSRFSSFPQQIMNGRVDMRAEKKDER